MDECILKRKRKRSSPNKKWTMEEEEKICEFLKDEGQFEKPTAHIFYKKLMDKEPEISTTWDLLRWKVRNMKRTYVKAEDWRKSSGARLLLAEKGPVSVKARLIKICPHYDILHEIFGARTYKNPTELLTEPSHIQKESKDIQQRKLELEKDKFENELLMAKRKLAIEEERFRAELEFRKEELSLRRLELEKDERLKIMELECKERVAMYEIEMKYKQYK